MTIAEQVWRLASPWWRKLESGRHIQVHIIFKCFFVLQDIFLKKNSLSYLTQSIYPSSEYKSYCNDARRESIASLEVRNKGELLHWMLLEISSNMSLHFVTKMTTEWWWEWNYKANSVGLSSDSIVYMKIFPDERNNSYYVISFDEAILGLFNFCNHFHGDWSKILDNFLKVIINTGLIVLYIFI